LIGGNKKRDVTAQTCHFEERSDEKSLPYRHDQDGDWQKFLLLTFSVVTAVIGVRPAINRRANELRRMNPA
jgi:hypothetical protein